MRRYEILLPLRFNDGVLVPDELVGDSHAPPGAYCGFLRVLVDKALQAVPFS